MIELINFIKNYHLIFSKKKIFCHDLHLIIIFHYSSDRRHWRIRSSLFFFRCFQSYMGDFFIWRFFFPFFFEADLFLAVIWKRILKNELTKIFELKIRFEFDFICRDFLSESWSKLTKEYCVRSIVLKRFIKFAIILKKLRFFVFHRIKFEFCLL